ncbi:MAG: hypothetical protein JNK87_38445 [Bryobacterales bacterium]|nr:hypothetical protein [Bryobacterales bacterium]
MAFGSEAYGRAAIGVMVLVMSAAAAERQVAVRHPHLYKEGAGTLALEPSGLTYQETGKPGHSWSVRWDDVQQLWVSAGEMRVLTYRDQRWQLGRDREFELAAAEGVTFTPWVTELKEQLGQRMAMAVASQAEAVLWRVPVKLRKGFGGSEGVLRVTAEGVVYESEERGESRTWRFEDIENVASAGRFELTLTTYERAKLEYGDKKGFHFQLKRPMEQRQYEALWRRLHDAKQLQYLTDIKDGR